MYTSGKACPTQAEGINLFLVVEGDMQGRARVPPLWQLLLFSREGPLLRGSPHLHRRPFPRHVALLGRRQVVPLAHGGRQLPVRYEDLHPAQRETHAPHKSLNGMPWSLT